MGHFSTRPHALLKLVAFLSLSRVATAYSQEGTDAIISVNTLDTSNAAKIVWIPIVTHGLMLTHPSPPARVSGAPLIESPREEDSESSLFSPALSGDSRPFVAWDEALADELADMPWRRRALTGTRDVVKRTGSVRLIRRSDTKGPDELEYAITSQPNLIHSRSQRSGLDERRMVRKAVLTKRSHKNKRAKTNLVSSFAKASKQIGDVMKGAIIETTITWYTGHDLLNPYCVRKSHWTPTDDSLVIAVTQKWELRPACGEFLEISMVGSDGVRKGKSVIARVVDLCGGCKPEVSHADLSKAAFTRLFNLDVGIVSGLAMRKVSPPKKWSNKLYGPRDL